MLGALAKGRRRWRGKAPHDRPIHFVSPAMGMRPDRLGHRADLPERYGCAFFGTGLVDRTGTLGNAGLTVLDPIPAPVETPDLATLCAERAQALIAEAAGRPIRVLWSGGIDSTAALVSLLAAGARPEVTVSREAEREHPKLAGRLMDGRDGATPVPMRAFGGVLGGEALVVTGEHGDQLFGSMLAGLLDDAERAAPWREVLPARMRQRLGERGHDALRPAWEALMDAAPVPITSAFEALWWANFATKWQAVKLRMLAGVSARRRADAAPRLRHFFDTEGFQRWSLANPDLRIRRSWESYKWPLKEVIYAFDGDASYRDRKTKERSLRAQIATGGAALAMDADHAVWHQPREADDLALPRARGREGGDWTLELDIGE